MTARRAYRVRSFRGTRHVVLCGNFLAAGVVEVGGDAVDAGVEAGIALGVVECEMVGFAGIELIIIRIAGCCGWPI